MSDFTSAQTFTSREASNCFSSSKQILTLAVVVGVVALVAMQWHSWQTFDWHTFVDAARGLDWLPLLASIALILITHPLRAWRWQIFLRPVREAKFRDVFTPTLIGFTGLALLGRPGELARPYMIAKRTNLPVASQMGVWTVERLFDMGAFAVIAVIDFFFASGLPDLRQFRTAAWIAAALMVAMGAAAVMMCRAREALFELLEKKFATRYPASRAVLSKARAFSEGLHTVRDFRSFILISLSSVAIWAVTALSCLATLHAYSALKSMSFSSAVLLMGFSMIGGLAQLPAVGGGAQLATIVAMVDILGVPRELAVSAGILLWLVSFHSVTPIGLAIARRAHVSLRDASRELDGDRADQVREELPGSTGQGIPSGTFAHVPQ